MGIDLQTGLGLAGGAVLGLGGGYALVKAMDQSPEELERIRGMNTQELLDKNEREMKVLGGLMVGLPVAAGASLLAVKGLDAVAARTSGALNLLARGGSGAFAVAGGLSALGGIALLGGLGWAGLAAGGMERERIRGGENPYLPEQD